MAYGQLGRAGGRDAPLRQGDETTGPGILGPGHPVTQFGGLDPLLGTEFGLGQAAGPPVFYQGKHIFPIFGCAHGAKLGTAGVDYNM